MSIAWAVLTVSSEPQIGTIAHQRVWAETVSRERGWTLSRVLEGVASGKTGPRAICREVLLEIRAAQPDERPEHLLMIRLDRVGRGSIIDSQLFVRDLLALGARLFTRDAGEVRLDSAMDELIAAVQMAVARHENDVRRDKMRALDKRRKEAGEPRSNYPPYGLYIELAPKRRFVALETHKSILREMYRRRIAGDKVEDIARWMRANAPPMKFKSGREINIRWTWATMARIIRNRAYIGTIVDETTWLRAQRVSRYAGRYPPRRKYGAFPLSGMLRCECGRTLSGHARNVARAIKAGRGPDRYYTCPAPWHHNERQLRHHADAIEERFVNLLRVLQRDPSQHAALRKWYDYGQTLGGVDQKILRIKQQLERLETARARAWRLDEEGLIDAAEVARRLGELDDRKSKVQAQLVELMRQRTLCADAEHECADIEKLCRSSADEYVAASVEQKQVLARAIILSLGGLRVRANGSFVAGIGKYATPQDRLRKTASLRWQSRTRIRGRFVCEPLYET